MTPRKPPAKKAAPRQRKPPEPALSVEERLAKVESQVQNLAVFLATGIAQQLQQQRAAQQGEANALAVQLLNGGQ